jgi:hypothetical protein
VIFSAHRGHERIPRDTKKRLDGSPRTRRCRWRISPVAARVLHLSLPPGEAAPAARCKRGGHGAPASDFVPRKTESRPWLAQSLLWRCVCYRESGGEDKPRSIAKEYGEVCCGVQSPSTVLSEVNGRSDRWAPPDPRTCGRRSEALRPEPRGAVISAVIVARSG